MIRTLKIRVYPNKEQVSKIEQTLGTLRYIWNFYLGANELQYKKYKEGEIGKKNAFISANVFDKAINHDLDKETHSWIFEISTKARKDILTTAEKAYTRFFKGKSKFPRFKSKKHNPVKSFFFIKDGVRVENNRIWIPILHYIKFSENGFDLEQYFKSKNICHIR